MQAGSALDNHVCQDPSRMDIDVQHDSLTQHLSQSSSLFSTQSDGLNSTSSGQSNRTSRRSRSTPPLSDDVATILKQHIDGVAQDELINDGYLALGSIRLIFQGRNDNDQRYVMHGQSSNEPYPNVWMSSAVRKDWIRIQEMTANDGCALTHLQIYVLPEDVNRGNRGPLRDFRKFVKRLLEFLDRSVGMWSSGKHDMASLQAYEMPRTAEEESLFYIFNTLQSPCPDLSSIHTSVYGYQAVSDVMNDSIRGLRTQLYPYQRRSVAAMVQREAEPTKVLDQRKRIFTDMLDQPFYLDIHEGALLRNTTRYTEPQGGILAETMGYGKTLICIALILATRGHYPKVPEGRVDSVTLKPRDKVGSLLAMAARRAMHEGVPWKAEFHALSRQGYHFDRCLAELKKYDRAYAEPIFTPTTPNRKGKRESANVVRLCSATLIVLPPNLLGQWRHEIQKHTDTDSLDVLVVDQPTKEIPPWNELLHYDVVLITKPRFEQEYRDDDLNQGKLRRGDIRYRSPLTDVRWLRVICDEGHGFAGSSSRTNAMAMLDKMYIERRWVVSGTPSSTLHGVEVGLSTIDVKPFGDLTAGLESPMVSARQTSLEDALQRRRTPNARELEAKDLDRLRLIVVNFLRLQPWANQRGSSDVANWKTYLGPMTDSSGHNYTSPALRDVLQSLIIRHRIEDIDTDLMLPPLYNRVVYLKPSYHDKMAINMFFLVLASNYVTSEREDEDYMFHPRNRKKLDLLINNLRQASFHWVGFSEDDIRETLRISNEYLDKSIDRVSDADGMLLTEAIMNGERALADPSWRAFATLHEIGVYVRNFPEHAREAWALDGKEDNPVLLGTVQAREAQKYVKTRIQKGASCDLSGMAGAGVKAMNTARNRAFEERNEQQKTKARSAESEKQQLGASEEPKLKNTSTSSAMSPRVSRFNGPMTVPQKRRHGSEIADTARGSSQRPALAAHVSETVSTALSKPTVAAFTSSKLSYLIKRLLTLPTTTKSLVFYQHNNTAFFIAEALELLAIPFRIYANTLSVAQRNQYLADFNSEDSEIKVLLMDIKQASQGLHIACASYVCIVSPIWDAGVESQAIKRAHRIGQTKEVEVETLVLQGTFEEDMVKRRKWKDENLDAPDTVNPDQPNSTSYDQVPSPTNTVDLRKGTARNGSIGKSLLDDRHMVSVLKDIKFLKFRDEESNVSGRFEEMHDIPDPKRMLFGSFLGKNSDAADGALQNILTKTRDSGVSKPLPRRGADGHFKTKKAAPKGESSHPEINERLHDLSIAERLASIEPQAGSPRKKPRVEFAVS